MARASTWIHNRMVYRSPRGSHKLRSIGCEQVTDHIFWRGPHYNTRLTGVRSRVVQSHSDIVRRAIVLSVVSSFKSCRFQQVSSSTWCARCVWHSQDFLPRQVEHNMCMKSTSTMLNPGRSADKPTAIALLHRKVVKKNPRSHDFWNCRNLKSWSRIFKFLHITQRSCKQDLHSPRAAAINPP